MICLYVIWLIKQYNDSRSIPVNITIFLLRFFSSTYDLEFIVHHLNSVCKYNDIHYVSRHISHWEFLILWTQQSGQYYDALQIWLQICMRGIMLAGSSTTVRDKPPSDLFTKRFDISYILTESRNSDTGHFVIWQSTELPSDWSFKYLVI